MEQLTFTQLLKYARQPEPPQAMRLVLMGDCSTQHLATALRGTANHRAFPLQVLDTDYDQIPAQAFDANSQLYRSAADAVLIFRCSERLYMEFCAEAPAARERFAEKKCAEIREIWQAIRRKSGMAVYQFDFPENDDRVFGEYALCTPQSYLYQLRRLNVMLADAARETPGVSLIGLAGLQSRIGREAFFDEKLYFTARMPVALTALPQAAALVLDVLQARAGRIKKCVVLDLDNTLWGGVIGDDGMENIQIGELGQGRAFTAFQQWLRQLRQRGILLAVCSKNNEETAKEPFLHHPDMVLRLEDFAVFVANWEDKATNIRRIQQSLNLGMDSFVFLDDNPFERSAVSGLIPEITVPELPEDPAQYVSFLQKQNLFETASYSEADADRTDQYRAQASRELLRQSFADYGDYLRQLEMQAQAKPFDAFHMARIAQLSQRSNQFNLRTVRYTADELERVAADPSCVTRYFTLRDRMGDYGLISAVILKKQDAQTAFIDTWFMSCRVLKRGMEEFIVNKMVEAARDSGCTKLIGEYLPTAKNAMVQDIYPRFGFAPTGEGRYTLDCESYVPQECFIREE